MARAIWLEARDLDHTWAVPSFNLARNYLDNANYFDSTLAKSDVQEAEKYLNEAEKRASLRKHSEDNQVLAQLPTMRQWLCHKKNKFQMI